MLMLMLMLSVQSVCFFRFCRYMKVANGEYIRHLANLIAGRLISEQN
jgi:hypothetical protein